MEASEWMRLLRLRPHYVLAIICGFALSGKFSALLFIVLAVFAYSALFYGTLVNLIHDLKIDSKNPSLQNYAHVSKKVALADINKAALFFLLLTVLSGIALAFSKKSASLVLLTAAAVHAGYSYSVPPLRLKRFFWGGAATYTLSTSIVFAFSALASGAVPGTLFWLTASSMWTGSLSGWAVAHISDKKYDRAGGLTTPPMVFGKKGCILMHRIFIGLSSATGILAARLINAPEASLFFAITFATGCYIGERIRSEGNPQKVRRMAYNFGTLPYWTNMGLLTALYFFM